MSSDEACGGGHAEQGTGCPPLAPRTTVPRRLARPLRRGCAARRGPRCGPRQPCGRGGRREGRDAR